MGNVAKMTSKNQITVPKIVRDFLNLKEGSHIAFVEEDGKMVCYPANYELYIDFANDISKEAQAKGITEEEAQKEAKEFRRKMNQEIKESSQKEVYAAYESKRLN